jgi:hypothetical protein
LAKSQFDKADCMSDKFCAFNLLLNSDNEYRQQISADFYQVSVHLTERFQRRRF